MTIFRRLKCPTGAQNKFNISAGVIRTVLDMTDMLSRWTGQIIILFQLMNDGLKLILDRILAVYSHHRQRT